MHPEPKLLTHILIQLVCTQPHERCHLVWCEEGTVLMYNRHYQYVYMYTVDIKYKYMYSKHCTITSMQVHV